MRVSLDNIAGARRKLNLGTSSQYRTTLHTYKNRQYQIKERLLSQYGMANTYTWNVFVAGGSLVEAGGQAPNRIAAEDAAKSYIDRTLVTGEADNVEIAEEALDPVYEETEDTDTSQTSETGDSESVLDDIGVEGTESDGSSTMWDDYGVVGGIALIAIGMTLFG